MACSNPSVTILSKYLCVPEVINYLSLSLWTTQANALWDSTFSSSPSWHQQATGSSYLSSQVISLPAVLTDFKATLFNLYLFLKIGTFWHSVVSLKTCLTLPSTVGGLRKAIPTPEILTFLAIHWESVDFCLFWKACSKWKASLAF